jgi:hypothetical protein
MGWVDGEDLPVAAFPACSIDLLGDARFSIVGVPAFPFAATARTTPEAERKAAATMRRKRVRMRMGIPSMDRFGIGRDFRMVSPFGIANGAGREVVVK